MAGPIAPIQAVLFDAAGTLLRVREPVGVTYARIAARHGVELPAQRLEDAFGRVLAAARPEPRAGEPLDEAQHRERAWWRERVRETFRAADGTARFADFEAFFSELFDHYADAAAWQLLPGVPEALDGLAKQGLRLAVVSNFDQRLRPLLRELGIHDSFEAVTLPADAGAAKPDRTIFDVCLKRLGVPAHRAVYVGEGARGDVQAAEAAGLLAMDVSGWPSLAALPGRVATLELRRAAPPPAKLRPERRRRSGP